MTEPTDKELDAVLTELFGSDCMHEQWLREIGRPCARAVLARWGAAPTGEPVAWRSAVLDLIDDCPGLALEQDRWLSRRVKELDFPSAPQPAEPPRVPLTDEQMRAIYGSVDWYGYPEELIRATEAAHGIKGGQHGAE